MSDILKAFLEQTYGSLEKAKEADKLADQNPNAYHDDEMGNPNLEKEADDKFRAQIGGRILMQKSIKDSMSIPTQLKDGQLDNKTEAHPTLKKYDHSLEEHRGHKLGLIKIRDMPTGSVDSLYDNMFDDDSNLVE
jgi:hypothetical protein